jgi:hypothetical protein
VRLALYSEPAGEIGAGGCTWKGKEDESAKRWGGDWRSEGAKRNTWMEEWGDVKHVPEWGADG